MGQEGGTARRRNREIPRKIEGHPKLKEGRIGTDESKFATLPPLPPFRNRKNTDRSLAGATWSVYQGPPRPSLADQDQSCSPCLRATFNIWNKDAQHCDCWEN